MASNIPVHGDCVQCFNDMKLNKKYGYVIMSIRDKKEVVVDEIGDAFPADCTQRENEEMFNRLRKKILTQQEEPKYLLFDFKLETVDGRREKIAFINWCSDKCTINKKMIHSSTAKTLKDLFQGVSVNIQANDDDELDYNEIAKEVARKK